MTILQFLGTYIILFPAFEMVVLFTFKGIKDLFILK